MLRSWRPPGVSPLRWYEDLPGSALGLVRNLRRGRYDVIHAFHPLSAWAASRARASGDPPLVFSFHGSATRSYLVARRYRLEMIQEVVRRSAAVSVLSPAAGELFARYLFIRPEILPAGILERSFSSPGKRTEHPTIFCAADLSDPRKRGPLLMSAFARLRESLPQARLILAPVGGRWNLPGRPPAGVDLVSADQTSALAACYGRAWVSVLPAVHEALGLVVLESLASGTPVVAARSGASPAIVSSERIGALFEADEPDALLSALLTGLELGREAATAAACRAAAAGYEWSRLVLRYEDLYARVMHEPCAGV